MKLKNTNSGGLVLIGQRKIISMQATTDIAPKAQTPVIDINRYSSYTQLVRVAAGVFRVVTRLNLFSSTPLSVLELSQAKTWLIKQAQAQMFPNTIKTLRKKNPLPLSDPLQSLNVFLDKDGLLRVGGRLLQSMKDYESRHPLILHGKHHVSTMIIQSEHKRLCHAGPKLTLGSLQDIYHIISACRVVVHRWIRECTVCKRASPKITTQLMSQLPSARVLPTFANDRASIDYAGPFTLKAGSTRKPMYRKAYVVIFACLVTEACHIKLVSDLSAEAFLAALRRFVS